MACRHNREADARQGTTRTLSHRRNMAVLSRGGMGVRVAVIELAIAAAVMLATTPQLDRVETPTWRGWQAGSVGDRAADLSQHTAAIGWGADIRTIEGWQAARWSDPVRGYMWLERWERREQDTDGVITHYTTLAERSAPIAVWQIVPEIADWMADTTTDGTNPGDPGYGVPDGRVTNADLNYFVELWTIATERRDD